jgi:tetratricopeptide (TPR) repeat protein/MinD-like ATPase involved in chromosome partitioning or flagellar assembly
MQSSRPPGRVITFYSYKGGTGRSMALANIAWILACNGKRVLAIDWDLEAPGLHRYFRPFLLDPELGASEGLIDLIDRYATAAIAPVASGADPSPDWYLEYANFEDHVLGLDFEHFPPGGKIDLLPAGRQSDTYAVKVSSFNWQNFYDRLGGGAFLEAVKARARSGYDYVLIDSRTGVSDTAGICTAQMPDSLVVCFTYNNQSIKGAAAVARSALATRRRLAEERTTRGASGTGANADAIEDTPLPYVVFPVPMRVDAGESDRLALRQAFARESFSDLVAHISPSEVAEYWSGVEVPHRVFYAYEEVLAPFKDDAHDPKTVLAAFLRLTTHITDREVTDYRLPIAPEVRQRYLEAYAETPLTAEAKKARAEAQRETAIEVLVRNADAAIYALGDEEKQAAQQVLCRLVRIGREDEGGSCFPIRAAISDFDFAQRGVIGELARRGVLSVSSDYRTTTTVATTTLPPPMPGSTLSSATRPEQSVSFADGALVAVWPMLARWLEVDREFLIWRQQVRSYLADWERSGRDEGAFLSGTLLAEAKLWLYRRLGDLNASERAYIEASVAKAERVFEPPTRAAKAAPPPVPEAPAARLAPIAVEAMTAPVSAKASPRMKMLFIALGVVVLALLGAVAMFGRVGNAPTDVIGAASAPITASAVPDLPSPKVSGADAAIALGDQASAAGDLAQAAAAYARALALDPKSLEAALKLGRTREQQNDFDGADRAYQQAMAIAPDNPAPWLERGASLAQQGRFADAVADYTKALGLHPDAEIYFNRGAANEGLKQYNAAVVDYGAALTIKPDFVAALLARARLVSTKNVPAALADYERVLALPANTADQAVAREQIRMLKERAPPSAPQRIVLQYHGGEPVAAVEALRKSLASALKPATVTVPQAVTTRNDGDVRYFFAEDEAFARKVVSQSELLLAAQGVRVQLKLLRLDAKDFSNARAGTVELWLPSLTTTQLLPRPEFVQRPLVPDQAVPTMNANPRAIYKK